MATLPPKSNFTDTAVTQGGFRSALNQLRDYLAGLLGEQGTAAQARSALGLGALAVKNQVGAGDISTSSTYGSRQLGVGQAWVLPAGMWLLVGVSITAPTLEIYNGSAWVGAGAGTGVVISDGETVRLFNQSTIAITVHYRQYH